MSDVVRDYLVLAKHKSVFIEGVLTVLRDPEEYHDGILDMYDAERAEHAQLVKDWNTLVLKQDAIGQEVDDLRQRIKEPMAGKEEGR